MTPQRIPRLIRLPEVMGAMGLKSTAIYAKAKDGLLTPPIKLTARTSVWPESEIAAINAAVIAGKSEDEIRLLVKRLIEQRSQASAA